MRPHVLQAIPWPVQIVVGLLAHRKQMAMLHGQGTARFTPAQLNGFKTDIWAAIEDLLVESKRRQVVAEQGRKEPFWVLGGERPSEADAVLYGFVTSALVCEAGPTTGRIVRGRETVLEWARRIHEIYFPDYDGWS
jgi:hypothetical protein